METNRRGFFVWACAAAATCVAIEHAPIMYASAKSTPWLVGKVVCYLNGKRVRDVLEANAKEGWLVVRARDDKGHVLVDRRRKEIVKRVLLGQVQIKRQEWKD